MRCRAAIDLDATKLARGMRCGETIAGNEQSSGDNRKKERFTHERILLKDTRLVRGEKVKRFMPSVNMLSLGCHGSFFLLVHCAQEPRLPSVFVLYTDCDAAGAI